MDAIVDMPHAFPLMRGGGAFLVAIGLGILVGAFGNRRFRTVALIAGAGAGVIVMAVGGATKVIFDGLGYPAIWQWAVLGVAYAAEVLLINLLLRKVPDTASRQFWLWILVIVGAHFLILLPSHGPICGLLALLCMANAGVGLRLPDVKLGVFWAIDGVLKVGGGAAMIVVSYS